MPSILGKVYLITGAASGMGLATAKTLLSTGAMVALCDLNQDSLEQVIDELDADCRKRSFARRVDLTDRAALKAFLEEAFRET